MLKNSMFKTSSYDVFKAKVVDLEDCDEVKQVGDFEIPLPVKVTVEKVEELPMDDSMCKSADKLFSTIHKLKGENDYKRSLRKNET